MEDVLDVYHRPRDPECPVVCLDETSKQLIAETRVPIPAKPGRPGRIDYEYERNGTANIFMLFAPLEGRRHVEVTDRHTAADYAHLLKQVSDTWFPNAPKIALVQDNLSTHKPASLYEAFPAAEARRLVERFEWHYTPKHGSWLNMAETELSVLSGQCLERRIPDRAMLTEETAAWEAQRSCSKRSSMKSRCREVREMFAWPSQEIAIGSICRVPFAPSGHAPRPRLAHLGRSTSEVASKAQFAIIKNLYRIDG